MPALLIALIAAFRCTVRPRLELQAEILALRHQLAVLQRQATRRPCLGRSDRLLWVLLSRLWPDWRQAVQIVTPDTVVRALVNQVSGTTRRPESHVRYVSTETPSNAANCGCESCSRVRRRRISLEPVVGGFRVIVRHHDYLDCREQSHGVFHRAQG
jgi:hypothetical protein